METAEAVQAIGPPDYSPLKLGVNESSVRTRFGSPAHLSRKWDPSWPRRFAARHGLTLRPAFFIFGGRPMTPSGPSAMNKAHNLFNSLQTFDLGDGRQAFFYSLPALEKAG